ncbi:MAG: pyridoxamine 5'-phosphate oxidase family protein [Methylococcaceae bacterium]|nr:pyridoxamine 5'-phosphate oxidase family protein [Methylococcaceae bacterium]
MTGDQNSEQSRIALDVQRLITSQQTLLLATCSPEGEPEISYAPFVRDERGSFYIFISELAKHTRHLRHNPKASLLFIEPEAGCRNLYARARVVFNCAARCIAPESESYQHHLDALENKFGDTVALLRSLPDFHLFELTPETGQYIAGFGKAYTINLKENRISHTGG